MEATSDMDWIGRSANRLRDLGPSIVSGLGIGIVSIAGFIDDASLPGTGWSIRPLAIVIFGLGIWGLGTFKVQDRSRQVSELQRANAEMHSSLEAASGAAALQQSRNETVIRTLAKQELRLLATHLHHLSNERWSLFLKLPDGFRIVARHSADPTHDEAPWAIYPEGFGCLWRTWQNGEAVEELLSDPKVDFQAWLLDQEIKWGVPRDFAEALQMRSRLYWGFRVTDANGAPLGVVICESKSEPNPASQTKLDLKSIKSAVTASGQQIRFRSLLEHYDQVLPSLARGPLRSTPVSAVLSDAQADLSPRQVEAGSGGEKVISAI